jgi:ribosomal protein L35
MLKQAGDKRYRQSEKGKAAAKRGAQSEAAKAASKRYEESEKGKATRKSYWQSKAGRAVQTRYQQTPKGKAARNAAVKRHLQTLKGKATIKRYQQTPKGKAAQKRYKNSVKGKLTRKLWFGRWKKNNPEKVEAKMRLLKSLWCKKNRIHPAKRENWKFARDFADAKKYKTFRDYDLSSPEEFLKKHGKEIKAVLKKIDETYSVADARLKNYVYLLSDGSMWNYEMTFEQWLATLFYIGRGVCWRVLQHFAEAKYYLDEGKDAFDSETVSI